MKNLSFACTLLFLFLSACNLPQLNVLSETENEGVLAVSKTFGSTVTWKRTLSTNTSDGQSGEYELTIDSLKAAQKYKAHHAMLATDAALLFYKSLSETEKSNLSKVNIALPIHKDSTMSYKFRVSFLDTLMAKMAVVEELVSSLEHKDYEHISNMLGKFPNEKAKNEAIKYIKSYEADFGDIKGYVPLGFEFFKDGDDPVYTRFYALLLTNKQDLELSLDLSLDPVVPQISVLRYNHKF